MEQTRALVEDIGTRARDLSAKNDHELSSLRYTRQQVEALAKFAGAQSKALAAMDAGSFAAQLGLHTVVPGRVFSGAGHEIDAVASDFRSRGYTVETTGDGFHVRKKGEPPIELFVRPSEDQSKTSGVQHDVPAPATPVASKATHTEGENPEGKQTSESSAEQASRHSSRRRIDHHLGHVNDEHMAEARSRAEAESAMTLAQQAASIRLGHARSERDMLLAIRRGEMPRYIARVGPVSAHPTFANPNRTFVFATEPADLRGLTPAEALFKVGWGRDWAAPNIDHEIEVIILDTHAAIPDPATEGASARVGVDRMEWVDLKRAALSDRAFLEDVEARGISPAEAAELFDIAGHGPLSEALDRAGPQRAPKMEAMLKVLNTRYSVNELYTGISATMNEAKQHGGREVMVRPSGTGLRLTPSNHVKVSLGIMTQEDFDRVYARPPDGGGKR
jgi:hypothetical protein